MIGTLIETTVQHKHYLAQAGTDRGGGGARPEGPQPQRVRAKHYVARREMSLLLGFATAAVRDSQK